MPWNFIRVDPFSCDDDIQATGLSAHSCRIVHMPYATVQICMPNPEIAGSTCFSGRYWPRLFTGTKALDGCCAGRFRIVMRGEHERNRKRLADIPRTSRRGAGTANHLSPGRIAGAMTSTPAKREEISR